MKSRDQFSSSYVRLNLPTKNSIKAYFVLRPISVEYRNKDFYDHCLNTHFSLLQIGKYDQKMLLTVSRDLSSDKQ